MALTLIIGGVKSGKSSHGEFLLTASENPKKNLYYIASALSIGDEMKSRIEKHQAQRENRFVTFELEYNFGTAVDIEGSNIVSVLQPLSTMNNSSILLECMATWLGGMLSFSHDLEHALVIYHKERDALIKLLKNSSADIVLISNEVGMGLIGSSKLERCYADEMGLLNQKLGSICDHVIQVTAGFPVNLK